ncbi:MAG: hypothetical protein U0T07_09615 [Chitinophagales bacterium]
MKNKKMKKLKNPLGPFYFINACDYNNKSNEKEENRKKKKKG